MNSSNQFKEKRSIRGAGTFSPDIKNAELLSHAIEALPLPFYIIDVNNYRIEHANSATFKFGPITELTTCYQLTHKRNTPCKGPEHACPLNEVKNNRKPVILEHVHYDTNNEPRNCELHAYPIIDNNGQVTRIIEFSLDITERKKAEAALNQAREALEQRVHFRTVELEKTNDLLRIEISERKKTEEQLINYQQRLRSLASELTLTEEYHRRKVATDLHDGIGQTLALSKIKLSEIISTKVNGNVTGQLKEILALLEGVIQDTRNLTFRLSPPILYELGFIAALEWLVEYMQERFKLPVHLHKDKTENKLEKNVSIVLFRAVREILVNIAKHANAKNVNVSVSKLDNYIEINIKDDGEGFDIESDPAYENKGGYGLFSIRERLNPLGGLLKISSQRGKGTIVLLRAPLKVKTSESGKYYVY